MINYLSNIFAGVMELADVLDSKSSGGDTVPVRPRSPAPYANPDNLILSGFFIIINEIVLQNPEHKRQSDYKESLAASFLCALTV